jgi:DNA-binding SARP family transcriptional activator/predicted ATPase
MMARLSLSLLGPFQVTLDGQPVTGFESNKVRALLAYLAVEADRPHRREALAGLLWGDWPDREALGNLRYALSNLRGVIGDRAQAGVRVADPAFLLVTRDTLQCNSASDYWLDVAAFTDLTGQGQIQTVRGLSALDQAVALYRGSFLEGFSVVDSPDFEEWALLTRERLARKMSSVLHRLSTAYEQRGEFEQAQTFAWRQLELEPWDEAAHRHLMRALALGGRRSAALAQYETCRRVLGDELGVEPGEETTRLYERIRDGTLQVVVPAPAPLPEHSASPPLFIAKDGPQVEAPVFVAREGEVAQLGRSLDLALAGQGRVVFVTGEAGSGKTTLVQEFTRRALDAHGELIAASGNCNAYTGVGDPYLPFREILESLTGDVEAKWAAGMVTSGHARRLWSALPHATEALLEEGPDLIDTFVPGAPLLERAMASGQRPGWKELLIRLDSLVEREPPGLVQDFALSAGVPSHQQSRLFEQYTRVLQALACHAPLVLVVDDLQWADAGSVNLLFHLGRQLSGSAILLIGAYRSEDVTLGRDGARHPLLPVVNELKRESGEMAVNVDQAKGRDFVEALLDSEPNRLEIDFREMLYRQTRGQPLFTTELLRGLQEQGDLVQDSAGRWVEGPALDWETLPVRVEAVIAERVGRLPEGLQAALMVASVEGEVFTAEVVARVRSADEGEIVGRLSGDLDRKHRLVRAQGLQRMDGQRLSHYRFRHILFQRYLYNSLDEVERAHLHEAVGNTLEMLYADQMEAMAATAATAAVAGQLAWHYQEAGIAVKAIHYLLQAGKRAAQLSAHEEGTAHLTRGLDMLVELPDPGTEDERRERAEQELALQLALGVALAGLRYNHPARVKAYGRARELCERLGQTSQLSLVLGRLSVIHFMRSEHQKALELAEEALRLAQEAEDPLHVALGHRHLGLVLFCLGEYTTARDHLEQMISFYRPQQHHRSLVALRGSDAGTSALAYHACCLWCLGYPDEALRSSREALALARQLGHPFSLADVLWYAGCMLSEMRRDAQALKDFAEESIQLANEKVPSWTGAGTFGQAVALVMLGQLQEGMPQMREAMAAYQARGSHFYLPGRLCSLAEAQAKAGHPEEALTTVTEALAVVEETGERHWEAELHRQRAELLLVLGNDADAEISFRKAIEVARRQSAKSWELRAAIGLARLQKRQGRTGKARQGLGEIYGWFSEGFDTPDLQEAKALLGMLS